MLSYQDRMSPDGVERLQSDALLGPTVERHGPRAVEPAENFFARFVRSIASQQVSTAAARAIYSRIDAGCTLEPASILDVDPRRLRDAGLSEQKTRTVRQLATAFEERGWSREYFADMSNDEVILELTTIRGVGVWTAKMQLIFSLARRDVFPVEDLGIRRAVVTLTEKDLTRPEMVDIAHRWRPYRSLASLYLWDVVDD